MSAQYLDNAPNSDYLPNSIPECHKIIKDLRSELAIIEQLNKRIAELEKQVRRNKRITHGPRSAKLSSAELTDKGKDVYNSTTEDLEDDKNSLDLVPEPNKHSGGGRTIPNKAKQSRHEFHEISDPVILACPCCGSKRQKIGFDTNLQLDIIKSVFEQIKHVQFKYSCPKCKDQIITAPKPFQPIDKGYATAALIAHVAVSKFDWHQPLCRQEKIYTAQGIPISRASMCRWLKQGAELLQLIVIRMHRLMLKSRLIQSDATTMPVLKRGLGKTHTGYTWLYRNDKYLVYKFSETQSGKYPSEFLKGFKGILLTDGAPVYNDTIKQGATKAGCSAHAYRYFEDARKDDPENADVGLAYFKSLFFIERLAANMTEDERKNYREKRALPRLSQLKTWLDCQTFEPKTAFGEAITYCKNQWSALELYASTGFVPSHNNLSENAIRPAVLGRRNWLFAGSIDGGNTASVWMSLIQTCHNLKIDPFEYLKDVLTKLPATPTSQIDQFLPDVWKSNRA